MLVRACFAHYGMIAGAFTELAAPWALYDFDRDQFAVSHPVRPFAAAGINPSNYAKKLGLPNYSSHHYCVTNRTELTDLAGRRRKRPALPAAAGCRGSRDPGSRVHARRQPLRHEPRHRSQPRNGNGNDHSNANGNGANGQDRNGDAWACTSSRIASALYQRGEFAEAAAGFETLASLDKPGALLAERCRALAGDVPPGWNGIYKLDTK